MSADFASLSIAEFLTSDPRPTFVVELDGPENKSLSSPAIIYFNPALHRNATLSAVISELSRNRHAETWRWVTAHTKPVAESSKLHVGVYWTRTTIQDRWVVVSGNAQAPDTRQHSPLSPLPTPPQDAKDFLPKSIMTGGREAYDTGLPLQITPDEEPRTIELVPAGGSIDTQGRRDDSVDQEWTVSTSGADEEPFFKIITAYDWASTPLGPHHTWSPQLQHAVNQIMVDSRCLAVYWGSDYTAIYNEAFSTLCGKRYSTALGKPVDEIWPGKGEHLRAKMAESALRKRPNCIEEECCVFVGGAEGSLRETYLKWSLIPLTEYGKVVGFIHSVIEITSMRLWERRMKMLIDLGESLVTARDIKAYWRKTIEHLEAVRPTYDIPLAILYSVSGRRNSGDSSDSNNRNEPRLCHLEGSLGVPRGHPIAPPRLNPQVSDRGLAAAFRLALQELKPIPIRMDTENFPPQLFEGLQWRGFGDPCQEALVCPIRPTKDEEVMGILVLGLNPRRPYDNGYRQYISLFDQMLRTCLASTVLLEEEARRGKKAAKQAAQNQALLMEKIGEQAKEANEFMQRFESVAQFLPVGVSFGDGQGNITFANDAWYRITGIQRSRQKNGHISIEDFLAVVLDEDRKVVVRAIDGLRRGENATFEFRVKRYDRNEEGNGALTPLSGVQSPSFEKAGMDLVGLGDTRVCLASAKPEMSANSNKPTRIMICLTDVTLHKRTAEEAVRRAQQAENLKRMAELATVGMYGMDLEGTLLEANKVFYEMCGIRKADDSKTSGHYTKPFDQCVVAEDLDVLKGAISRLVSEGKTQTAELRFKKDWSIEDEDSGVRVVAPRWMVATLMPVRDADGVICSFTGCLSDASLQKWQLERERLRKEDAIESKRQQESFIDMTSHEMRNPLSAIIHCADAVIASLTRCQRIEQRALGNESKQGGLSQKLEKLTVGRGNEGRGWVKEITSPTTAEVADNSLLAHPSSFGASADRPQLIKNGIDNAETIILCAQHQKRIVDDILTMSKLDSKLLVVTPVTADPIQIVQESLKMFEVEARRVDIELRMTVDQSYRDLDIEFLNLDPSRVKQVLINLLTNALKFTSGSGPTRVVSVGISASTKRPDEGTSAVQFITREDDSGGDKKARETDDDNDYKQVDGGCDDGKPKNGPIYIMFEVKDTGQGLNEQEKKILFKRFVQASSRTHVKYGGSGLGLFISRRLTEMQNGAIGVASSPGVGSTFAFYIQTSWPDQEALEEARSSAKVLAAAAESSGTPPKTSKPVHKRPPLVSSRVPPSPMREDIGVKGIMIVEDNLINQQVTRRMLGDRGYAVDVANHGLEALEKLRTSSRFVGNDSDLAKKDNLPNISASSHNGIAAAAIAAAVSTATVEPSSKFELDVILMDIEMPIQDGLACTRAIRELERQGKIITRPGLGTSRLPIIAVSANARMEQILEAKAAGCDDVLVKPYRMPELMEKMRIVLNSLRATSPAGSE